MSEHPRAEAMSSPESRPSGQRTVAFPQWLREYERPWLRYDLIAGASVAALVVPKALGYAGIVGVPIEYGLYAAAGRCLDLCPVRYVPTDLDRA